MSEGINDKLFGNLAQNYAGRDQRSIAHLRDLLRQRLFARQRAVLDDPARLIAVRVGRRGGKTYAAGSLLLDPALARHDTVCYYITQRLTRARDLMWDSPETGIKKLDKDIAAGLDFKNTTLTAVAPQTGSIIRLFGAETRADIDKLRGEPFSIAIVDEVRNFNPRMLDSLLEDVLMPSAMDHGGKVILMSNPGHHHFGLFYEATKEGSLIGHPYPSELSNKFSWSTHHWNAEHNEAMPHIWQECLDYKEARGWSDHNPRWQIEYLGNWADADDDKVFRFSPERNTYDPDPNTKWGLPDGHDWRFLCGWDFGVQDDCAMVILASAMTTPIMYEVYTYRDNKKEISEIRDIHLRAEAMFGRFDAVVGDTGGLGAVFAQELSKVHGLHMEHAQKKDKLGALSMVNSDLFEGRIKIRRTSLLRQEMEVLQWADADRTRTVKGQKDHASDAFLYTWRRSIHHMASNAARELPFGSREYWEDQAKRKKQQEMRGSRDRNTLDGKTEYDQRLDVNYLPMLPFDYGEWM